MQDIAILTSTAEVAALAAELAREAVIAVDLEADSMHNYREKVCLLQFSSARRTWLLDPLAGADLAPLRPLLADASVRKIFHAADYDLRSLRRDFEISVDGLFDTMICAQLLGEERIGLADLLGKYFDISLDKQYQRADWSQRPLPPEMLRYAAGDTCHLHRLADLLEQRLREVGRLDWAEEEFALQQQVQFNGNDGPLCLRFKGANTLQRRQLGVLEMLLQWRESEGERRDRPVYKVLGNKPLLELAQRMPESREDLRGIEGLPPRLLERFDSALLAAVARGRQISEDELPQRQRQPRRTIDPELEPRLKRLKRWRQGAAADYRLDPGVLINNAALEAVARSMPRTPEQLDAIAGLKAWQKRELGEALIGVLA
jgi:ribonuclease D